MLARHFWRGCSHSLFAGLQDSPMSPDTELEEAIRQLSLSSKSQLQMINLLNNWRSLKRRCNAFMKQMLIAMR